MYGLPVAGEWGGLFSDLVRVPYAEAMLVPVAADLPTAPLSSVGDNLALAHECLAAHLQARPGAITLILGSASVGLYAVQLAFALGAEHVLYVDADPAQRELAASLGAQTADALPSARDARFDLALDAAANEDWLRAAAGLLQPEGVLECPSIYFKKSVALPLFEMSIRGVTLHAGRGNAGPHIRPLLDLIAADAIEPDHICAETIPWDSAPEALADPSLKPVLVRD
jgi:alcohol dehydrogenase